VASIFVLSRTATIFRSEVGALSEFGILILDTGTGSLASGLDGAVGDWRGAVAAPEYTNAVYVIAQ